METREAVVDGREPSEFGRWLFGIMKDRGFEDLGQATSCAHDAGFTEVKEETLRRGVYDNALQEMLGRESWGPALKQVLRLSEEEEWHMVDFYIDVMVP
jgi:hypothetical protein